MASSIAVSRLAAAEVSIGSSLAADNDNGYYEQDYEQQYNRITGHNSSDVSHKPHSTSKVEEEDDDEDGGLNTISLSCNEDEEDDNEKEDVVGHETKTTIERRKKKIPCHRNISLNRSLIGIIKPRLTNSQDITDTSILRGQEANFDFDSLFDSVVLEMDTRKVRRVNFNTRLEIYFFE